METIVISFRNSVLGHLDNVHSKLEDSVLLNRFGFYKDDFDRSKDFVSHIDFEELKDFRIYDPAKDETREIKIFYVGLLAKENTTYNDLTFECVKLKDTKVCTSSSILNAQLFDPVQKYFETKQHKIQALQKKFYTDKFSRSLYDGQLVFYNKLHITNYFRFGS